MRKRIVTKRKLKTKKINHKINHKKNIKTKKYTKKGGGENNNNTLPKWVKKRYPWYKLIQLKTNIEKGKVNNFDVDAEIRKLKHTLDISRFDPSNEYHISKHGLDEYDLHKLIEKINVKLDQENEKYYTIYGPKTIHILYSKELDKLFILFGEHHGESSYNIMKHLNMNKNFRFNLIYINEYLDKLFRNNGKKGTEFDFYFENAIIKNIQKKLWQKQNISNYKTSNNKGMDFISTYELLEPKNTPTYVDAFYRIYDTFFECFKKDTYKTSICESKYENTRFHQYNFRGLHLTNKKNNNKNTRPKSCIGKVVPDLISFINHNYIIKNKNNNFIFNYEYFTIMKNAINNYINCINNARIVQNNDIINNLKGILTELDKIYIKIINNYKIIYQENNTRYKEHMKNISYDQTEVDILNSIFGQLEKIMLYDKTYIFVNNDYEDEDVDEIFKTHLGKSITELVNEKHKQSSMLLLIKIFTIISKFFTVHLIDLYVLSRTKKEYQKKIIIYEGNAHTQFKRELLLRGDYGSYEEIFLDKFDNNIINYVKIPREITLPNGKKINL